MSLSGAILGDKTRTAFRLQILTGFIRRLQYDWLGGLDDSDDTDLWPKMAFQ